jgi:hypothetical protein
MAGVFWSKNKCGRQPGTIWQWFGEIVARLNGGLFSR